MNKAIIIGFIATSAAIWTDVKIPTTWEWYYWPAAIAVCVAAAGIVRTLREMAR